MKKILTGLIICIPLIATVSYYNIALLLESKVIIIFAIGIVASYFQADYSPLKTNINDVDKGTVLQIIWSVYLSQALALLEAFFLNRDKAFIYDIKASLFLTIALFGLLLRSWAYISLGKFFTMHLQTKTDQPLIEHGPYRFLRHPSYTGAFLTYTCIPLFLASYYSAAISALLLAFAFYRRITHEEKMLEEHMGEKYRTFCATRARLFPFIW